MYPLNAPGILVRQPFGEFVVVSLPARVLLDAAYSDRLTATPKPDGTYELTGSQRELAKPRLKEIGRFIDTGSASFPNTIILAANYRAEDGLVEDDDKIRWEFVTANGTGTGHLIIPTPQKLAAIIDGQHRLFGFNFILNMARLDMPLVCAVYFDLPKPYQARLFATINANQRPVSKSQTYELFGYNVEEEEPKKWTPEKFAVFLTRKLNAEEDSPFHDHIVVPAENDFSTSLAEARRAGDWAVSMATVVEGTVRLISSNPKTDAYEMAGELRYEGHSRSVLKPAREASRTPLRELFRECNDEIIHALIKNYFTAVARTLWRDASPQGFIRKTVGVQALFDISRQLLRDAAQHRDLRAASFEGRLSPARRIDFSDPLFEASGTGRTHIRKVLLLALHLEGSQKLSEDPHIAEYRRLIAG
ncbi:MAG: DGQHR domain-containing protein [Chthoniobacter sp.]|nr:DGQHR domain-containing protein [Chthoniobacter sp.]